MSRRLFLATFADESRLLAAIAAARNHGWPIVDAHTPYPVHGLDEAMGLAASRLPWACFACGLAGALAAFGFQMWTMAVDWPLNVGGKPLNSWPAFMPVVFEVMVLFAGFGVVLAFLARCRLFPGKRAALPAQGVTNGQFVLVLEENDASFGAEECHRVFSALHAVRTEEREEGVS